MTVIIYSIGPQASFSCGQPGAIAASRVHATGALRIALRAIRNNFVHFRYSTAQSRCAGLPMHSRAITTEALFFAGIALQQHETKKDSPTESAIGTVVAKLTRAFDNRFAMRRRRIVAIRQ